MGKPAGGDDTLKHIGVFSDVVAHIKSEYVEEPDMKSVTLGALNGLLEAVDPFASYLNAEQYKEYLKTKDIKRPSAGLILSKRFGYMGVVAPCRIHPRPRLASPPAISSRASKGSRRATCRWPTPR